MHVPSDLIESICTITLTLTLHCFAAFCLNRFIGPRAAPSCRWADGLPAAISFISLPALPWYAPGILLAPVHEQILCKARAEGLCQAGGEGRAEGTSWMVTTALEARWTMARRI